jgi:hypothetical protein
MATPSGRGWFTVARYIADGFVLLLGVPGSLDAHLKKFLKRATASWVAVMLEVAEAVTVDRVRPACIKLRPG